MIGRILIAWEAEPTVIIGLLALCWLYATYARRGPRSSRRQTGYFAGAIGLLVLALLSPIDFLADRYLFSVHMLQHLILVLAVAPLLAVSVPPALLAVLARILPGWLRHVGGNPTIIWLAAVIDMWVWHAPPLYEAALVSEPIHALEHLSFLVTACLFWLVALAPYAAVPALPVLLRMAYVLLAGIPNTILGIVITFAPRVLYRTYELALDQPGLGRQLQANLHLTARSDQELGGLLMWIPGGVVYLVIIAGIFIVWSAKHGPSSELRSPLMAE
ncbi:MAG: cytochrome c oxidase assembly protein [Chloroflexi bacterium]|nr:cytochrome c oxidase assembly protein [Chloroflexota bacterium]